MLRDDQTLANEKVAVGLLFVLPALFASNNVIARLADDLVAPGALAFWRWALTALFLLIVTARPLRRRAREIWLERYQIVVLGCLGMGLTAFATYSAALTTSVTNIGIIYASTPFIIMIVSFFVFGSRIGSRQIAGAILCLTGVLIIVSRGEPSTLARVSFVSGDVWAICGVVAWASYSVLLVYWPSRLTIIERASLTALAGAVAVGPFYVYEEMVGTAVFWSIEAIIIIISASLFAGFAVITLHAHVTAVLGSARCAILLYLIPTYNTLMAVFFLEEDLFLFQVFGGAVTLLGVAVMTLSLKNPVEGT